MNDAVSSGELRYERLVNPPGDLFVVEVSSNAVTVACLIPHVPLVLDRGGGGIKGKAARIQWIERHHVTFVQGVEPLRHTLRAADWREAPEGFADFAHRQRRPNRDAERYLPSTEVPLLPQEIVCHYGT